MRSTFDTQTDDYVVHSIIEAGTLDTWLDHIGTFVHEFKLRVSPEGFYARAVDSATVGMVETRLDKHAFESHRAGFDGDGSMVIGVSIERLQDALGLMGNDDLVEMGYDEETRMLHLRSNEIKRSFALIDPDSIRQEPDIPDLDLPTTVTMQCKALNTAFKACGLVSDHVEVGYHDGSGEDRQEGLYFYAEGDRDDTLVEPDAQEVLESGEAKSLLSGDYLEKIVKVVPNNDRKATITAGMEFPVLFELEVADEQGNDTIETEFLLAPRIPK